MTLVEVAVEHSTVRVWDPWPLLVSTRWDSLIKCSIFWLFQPNDLGTRSSGPLDPFIFRWFSTSQPAETNTSRRSRPHFPLGFIRLSTPCILPWRRAWHVDARVRDTWCWQSWGVHRVRLRVFEHVSMPRPSPSSLGTAHCRWPVSWQYLNTWDGSNTVHGIFDQSVAQILSSNRFILIVNISWSAKHRVSQASSWCFSCAGHLLVGL